MGQGAIAQVHVTPQEHLCYADMGGNEKGPWGAERRALRTRTGAQAQGTGLESYQTPTEFLKPLPLCHLLDKQWMKKYTLLVPISVGCLCPLGGLPRKHIRSKKNSCLFKICS